MEFAQNDIKQAYSNCFSPYLFPDAMFYSPIIHQSVHFLWIWHLEVTNIGFRELFVNSSKNWSHAHHLLFYSGTKLPVFQAFILDKYSSTVGF